MRNFSVLFKSTIFLVLLIFVTSCSPIQKYKSHVSVWEPDIRKFEQLDKTEIYPDDAILFMGSSSIKLWNSLQEDMQPYHTIQRGFGGAQISDVAWYTPRIVYPHKSKAIVIFIANEITGSDQDKTPEEIAGLFRYIVKTIRKEQPNTPVFYIQVTPTENRWKVWPKIQEGNALVKKQCETLPNVHFIETEKYFLDEDGKPKAALFIEDRLHLNRDGYKVWTGVIKQNLDSVLKQ